MEKDEEAKLRYFKRRSAEAIWFLNMQEIKVAAARMLALDPDAREETFINAAKDAWRHAIGEIACNSVDEHPVNQQRHDEAKTTNKLPET